MTDEEYNKAFKLLENNPGMFEDIEEPLGSLTIWYGDNRTFGINNVPALTINDNVRWIYFNDSRSGYITTISTAKIDYYEWRPNEEWGKENE